MEGEHRRKEEEVFKRIKSTAPLKKWKQNASLFEVQWMIHHMKPGEVSGCHIIFTKVHSIKSLELFYKSHKRLGTWSNVNFKNSFWIIKINESNGKEVF